MHAGNEGIAHTYLLSKVASSVVTMKGLTKKNNPRFDTVQQLNVDFFSFSRYLPILFQRCLVSKVKSSILQIWRINKDVPTFTHLLCLGRKAA